MTLSSERLSDYVDAFASFLETTTRLSPVTRTRYCYEVRKFASIIEDPPLEEISPKTLVDWSDRFHTAGAAASTVVQKYSALRRFFSYLEEFEESEKAGSLLRILNRMQPPVNKGPKRPAYVLEEEVVDQLLDLAGKRKSTGIRDRAIIHFLWAAGVRNFELTGLRTEKLILLDRMATVLGKGDKERLVVFDESCQQDIFNWLEDRQEWPASDFVFCAVAGSRLTTAAVSTLIRETAKRAQLGAVWAHLFRHTRITELLNGGMSLQDTATMAGHNDIRTTMRYFHQGPEKLKEAYDKATRG